MKNLLLFISLILIAFHSVSCEKVNDQKKQHVNNEKTELITKNTESQHVSELHDIYSFADLVKKLKPSVVNISTTNKIKRRVIPFPFDDNNPLDEYFRRFFGNSPQQEYEQKGLGTGFLISKDGYVVTNNHVVSKADDIEIIMEDGNKYSSKVIGTDPNTDLALLKIDKTGDFPFVRFGNSDDSEIGDWVLAIGNPFGLGHTVTAGIISAKGRVLGLGNYDDFIQTDAPINPGNSGGPLFNLEGEVVGVNTAIISRGQGIGFAIPGNLARSIIDQLKDSGKVTRGWIGLYLQKLSPEIAEAMGIDENSGILVADVFPNSPSEKAGLRRGDLITSLNGEPVNQITEFAGKVAMKSPGTKVDLDIVRNSQKKKVTITVEEMPETEKKSQDESESPHVETGSIGLNVIDVTPDLARRYNLPIDRGVIITSVLSGTVASEAGFMRGDIIVSINRQQIHNIQDYTKIIDSLKENETALFLVQRGSNTFYVGLKIPDRKG